jgi:uncharacterized protein YutE (UPF0331/DUF86 family)
VPEPGSVDLDRDVLLQRIQEIRGALASLRRDAVRPREAFVSDVQAVDATKYRLLVAIEAAAAICMHVTSRLSARTPEGYADCFEAMRDAAMLSPGLAERLGRMARFRNRLVHVYWRIDNERLWTILQENLGDLDEYLAAVGTLLDRASQA